MTLILGRKRGMTQLFAEDGTVVPVTIVEAGPCVVAQVRTQETDGYDAIQLGYEDVKDSRASKPRRGHCSKAGIAPKRFLREQRLTAPATVAVGHTVGVDAFKPGDLVDVIGTTKGRGFAGVMKRYGFKGGKASHGSMFHRKPASGGATDAARVFRGSRRPGHMGAEQVTVKNIEVVRADAERNLLVLKGAVPGPVGGLLVVTLPERAAIERGKGRFVTFTALEGRS